MNRDVKLACVIFVPFFGIFLAPKAIPWIAASPIFFAYALSLVVVIPGLIVGLVVGLSGLSLVRWFRFSPRSIYSKLWIHSAVALVACSVTLAVARLVSSALPTGSDLREFDTAVWQDSDSARYVESDYTPRQKMLGSVVGSFTAEMNRTDLEDLLGPSLETTYFINSERDLIYLTGPQRDSLFRIDSEWLLIWLDSSGRFERFEIWND